MRAVQKSTEGLKKTLKYSEENGRGSGVKKS